MVFSDTGRSGLRFIGAFAGPRGLRFTGYSPVVVSNPSGRWNPATSKLTKNETWMG